MDRNFFLNAGIHFEPPSQLPSWKLMSSVPEINEQSHIDRFNSFESNFSSMCSSPVSSVSPVFNSVVQKISWPIMDHLVKQNTPTLINSIPFDTNLPSLPTDPGFAERAAKFSCFGSRSFNGRTSQFRSSVLPSIGHSNLPRVSSSPSLKINGSAIMIQDNKSLPETPGSGYDNKTSSNEESSVSEQMEISNSRKRKAPSLKGKAKEIVSAVVKEEGNDELNLKKVKKTEEDVIGKTEEKSKIPEPPKDYIHVRARRGQATDSHSLAERVRREKIGERMKLLQDLVPGCNKVTGKALMLDEIINYVQSLQHQVEVTV